MTLVNATDAEFDRAEQAGYWCMRLCDNDLSTQDWDNFESWLEADPCNREAFDMAVLAWQEIEGAGNSLEFLPLRITALESVRVAKRARVVRYIPVWLRNAAAATIVILAGLGAWLHYTPDIYETGIGERHLVVLSDGSKISMDADTRVEVRYDNNRRGLTLVHGRAKFDVAKDPMRPFTVAAANRIVVATGTEFSVELLQHKVRVILFEGHVSVLDSGTGSSNSAPVPINFSKSRTAADHALIPGRELIADTTAPVADVITTDPTRSSSWEAGQLVFSDEPLALAVERVNRYDKGKIEIGDSRAGQVPITGVFTAGDTKAFVEGIAAVFPVHITFDKSRQTFIIHSVSAAALSEK